MAATLVVFDVDSTLLSVESLDFAVEQTLQSAPDGAERIRALTALTDQGMAGEIDFRTSLERRIAIAGLTRDDVIATATMLGSHLTPGMADLLDQLRATGTHVRAVSGGFVDLILPALGKLGFDDADIHANRFVYDAAGAVIDFDRDRPTSRSGGKTEIVRAVRLDLADSLAVMVGDGMTDFEVFESGAVDRFVGFGGIVERPTVRARAPAWAGNVRALEALLA